MKTAPKRLSSRAAASRELAELRARLAETEATLLAIRNGEVDAVLVAGSKGNQVFTLEGAGHAYRMLIESMNEGTLTLTADKTILYANQCFARMVGCPLERVIGGSFARFVSAEDRLRLRPALKRTGKSGAKLLMPLNSSDGTLVPVQISVCPLPRNGTTLAAIGMVVTDMTESRRSEERLRALTHRVVQVQEDERERVALELHDNITQLLCAVLFHSKTLADMLPARDWKLKGEAMKLCKMLGNAAEEVERISRNLRPSVLNPLGLVAVLRATSSEFADRTDVAMKLTCAQLTARLAASVELALYRILQESLKNVEKHAHARHVIVRLGQEGSSARLTINDDGIGFDPEHPAAGRNGKIGLGLLGMRERANYVGGSLTVRSIPNTGTEIEVRVPLK